MLSSESVIVNPPFEDPTFSEKFVKIISDHDFYEILVRSPKLENIFIPTTIMLSEGNFSQWIMNSKKIRHNPIIAKKHEKLNFPFVFKYFTGIFEEEEILQFRVKVDIPEEGPVFIIS